MNKMLIIDSQALCYIAYYANTKLRTTNGRSTGIYYGFWNTIRAMVKATGAVQLIFCWDSNKSLRKLIYPEYKSSRKNKTEPDLIEAQVDFKILRTQILPKLSFTNSFIALGYEADDIIASICEQYKDKNELFIATKDQDMYQLLDDNVHMIKFDSKIYTKEDFEREYGIAPKDWVQVKTLAGCSSDNVKGIDGIGEKRAIQFLQGELKGKFFGIIEKEKENISKINTPLVELPYPNTPTFDVDFSKYPNSAEWFEFCEEYEFQSFMNDTIFDAILTQTPIKGNTRLKKKLQF